MTTDLYRAERLSTGRASSLLHDAWILEDESLARVHSACMHGVLVLDVESNIEGTYRNGTAGEPRILVSTFEPLRTTYLADLDAGSLAWQAGEPPQLLRTRVEACLAAAALQGARIRSWAQEDVAEIHWGPHADSDLQGVSLDFVGTNPARRVGSDRVPTHKAPLLVAAALFTAACAAYLAAVAHGALTHRGLGAFVLFSVGLVVATIFWLHRPPRPHRIAAAR